MSVGNNASVPTLTEIVTDISDGEGIEVHYTYNGEMLTDVDYDTYPEFVVPALSNGEELEMRICTSSALEAKAYTITTNFTPADEVGILVLEDKYKNWTPNLGNDVSATLIFGTVNDTFNYCLTGVTSENETDYSLIYYADKPNRFEDWGGNNPGAFIGNETSGADGVDRSIEMSGSINLGMDLPHPNDANYDMNETDYREAPDFYCNGYGAKIWLINSGHYDRTNKTVDDWEPTQSLFETDLIQYDDTDWTPSST